MKKIAEIFVFLKGEAKKFTSTIASHFQAVDFNGFFIIKSLVSTLYF